jgi:hypothetical protein
MIYSDCSYITQIHIFNMIVFLVALFFGFPYALLSEFVFLINHNKQVDEEDIKKT